MKYVAVLALLFIAPKVSATQAMLSSAIAAYGSCFEMDATWAPYWGQNPGLVGYWKMNEGSWNGSAGEVLDSSGNGFTGAVNYVFAGSGYTTTTSSSRMGSSAGVFRGDSTIDYIPVAVGATSRLKSLITTGPFTIAAWVKITTLPLNTGNRNATYTIAGKQGFHSSLNISASGLPGFSLVGSKDGAGNATSGISGSALSLGVWHYLVATYDDVTRTQAIYVDGVKKNSLVLGTTSFVPYDYTTVPFNIGASSGCSSLACYAFGLNGSLDEVAAWDVALSYADVRKIYDQQSCNRN